MILLIDNYDSFAHNLARYFRRLGQTTRVVRNDAIDAAEVRRAGPQAVVLSPGPCTPQEAGCSLEIVRELHTELPILGICLGHQAIAAALGAKIVRAQQPMHGRTSLVEHFGGPLFQDLPSPLVACRYHSLVVEPDSLPSELKVIATGEDGTIMAIEHVRYPVFGLQFHPEAVLTEHGYRLLANFLELSGLPSTADVSALAADEHSLPLVIPPEPLKRPLTF
jgi:anthranilate synthase/aminodeoxychorismate synthase-like glutamine amidotransferase